MRKSIKYLLTMIFCISSFSAAMAVDVTLTVDEGFVRPSGMDAAERNLAKVLTEINRAQSSHDIVSVKNLQMTEFAKKSLARLWAVTPFYVDDEDVVERCWPFANGTMTVYHIPLIITPEGEDFGTNTYQDAVVEFNSRGVITDFRFAMDSQTGMSMDRCGSKSVVSQEREMIVMRYVEQFRTAYNQKDLGTIGKFFADDARIITGNVIMKKMNGMDENEKAQFMVKYTEQTKTQYMANLGRAFARNKWIDVQFKQIGPDGFPSGGCREGISMSKDGKFYGVRLQQSWKSSTYSDEGYLFLMWEFFDDGREPVVHVRAWQPMYVGKEKQEPNLDIMSLSGLGAGIIRE